MSNSGIAMNLNASMLSKAAQSAALQDASATTDAPQELREVLECGALRRFRTAKRCLKYSLRALNCLLTSVSIRNPQSQIPT